MGRESNPRRSYPNSSFQVCRHRTLGHTLLHAKQQKHGKIQADGEGFDPPAQLPAQQFSRLPPSTTRPPIRAESIIAHIGTDFQSVPRGAGMLTCAPMLGPRRVVIDYSGGRAWANEQTGARMTIVARTITMAVARPYESRLSRIGGLS